MTIHAICGNTFHLSPVGQAIQKGNVKEALRLVKSGHVVPDEEGGFPTLQQIILCCPNPHLLQTVIKRLPEGKINAIDWSRNTALSTAAKCRNIAVIELLVAAKADVNIPIIQTPLHEVLQRPCPLNPVPKTTLLQTVRCLLSHGASTKMLDYNQRSVLQAYVEVRNYDPKVMSLLVAEDTDTPKCPSNRVLRESTVQEGVSQDELIRGLKLATAVRRGLAQRKHKVTKVTQVLTSYLYPELIALINEYMYEKIPIEELARDT